MELTTLHRRCSYTILPGTEAPEPLKSDMIARGWDGNLYYGFKSNAKVNTPTSLFYRSATNGEFTFVY